MELGKAVLAASDARHESRGSLKRLDFPERDDEHFLAHSMTDVSLPVSWQPVHIVDMPPKAVNTDTLGTAYGRLVDGFFIERQVYERHGERHGNGDVAGEQVHAASRTRP